MFTVLYVSMLLLAGAAGFLIGCFVGCLDVPSLRKDRLMALTHTSPCALCGSRGSHTHLQHPHTPTLIEYPSASPQGSITLTVKGDAEDVAREAAIWHVHDVRLLRDHVLTGYVTAKCPATPTNLHNVQEWFHHTEVDRTHGAKPGGLLLFRSPTLD